MGTLPVIASTYRVTLDWSTSGGVTPHNVLHFFAPTGNETDLYNTLQSEMDPLQFAPMANAFVLVQFVILKLDGTSAAQTFPNTNGALSGGNGGQWSPATAALVKFATAHRGSRGRGRIFLGPIAESAMSDGIIGATEFGQLNTSWQEFADDMSSANKPMVIASYVHADQHEVLTCTADSVLATVRRRQNQLR